MGSQDLLISSYIQEEKQNEMHTTLLSTTRKDKCEDNLGFLTKTMDATKAWQKAGEAERHRSGTKAVSSFLSSFVKSYE